MNTNEKIMRLGGPGGLRCSCCGGSGGRKGNRNKRGVRRVVRQARRLAKSLAILEGFNDLD